MSDDYTPTTDEVRGIFGSVWPDFNLRAFSPERGEAFDRWLANELADAVMGFATHYLKYDDWVKARQYANDIREGNA